MRTCVVDIASSLVENVIERCVQTPGSTYVEATEPPVGKLWVDHATACRGWRLINGVLTDVVTVPPSQAEIDAANRIALDETQRIVVRGEAGSLAWLNMTPDEASQWVTDTFQARTTAGDTPTQAILFILRRLVRILLVVARRALRRNAQGVVTLDQR